MFLLCLMKHGLRNVHSSTHSLHTVQRAVVSQVLAAINAGLVSVWQAMKVTNMALKRGCYIASCLV